MNRIQLYGLEFTLEGFVWRVVSRVRGPSARLARATVKLLNVAYGSDWLPPFGVYEPDREAAATRAVVDELEAELLESSSPPVRAGRVY